MTETEWADLVNNTKEELKEKAREALNKAIGAREHDENSQVYFWVILSDNGNYYVTRDRETFPYLDDFLELFRFDSTDEELEFHAENFDFLFDNIWFQDIMFFLE